MVTSQLQGPHVGWPHHPRGHGCASLPGDTTCVAPPGTAWHSHHALAWPPCPSHGHHGPMCPLWPVPVTLSLGWSPCHLGGHHDPCTATVPIPCLPCPLYGHHVPCMATVPILCAHPVPCHAHPYWCPSPLQVSVPHCHSLVLAVGTEVTLGTLTGVTMGRARLAGAGGRGLAGVEGTSTDAVVTEVAWAQGWARVGDSPEKGVSLGRVVVSWGWGWQ